jgi:hypothetical protein
LLRDHPLSAILTSSSARSLARSSSLHSNQLFGGRILRAYRRRALGFGTGRRGSRGVGGPELHLHPMPIPESRNRGTHKGHKLVPRGRGRVTQHQEAGSKGRRDERLGGSHCRRQGHCRPHRRSLGSAGSPLRPSHMTAYQLAIELHRRHPQVAAALGQPLGGAGIGQHNSLAQYLPRELSRRTTS